MRRVPSPVTQIRCLSSDHYDEMDRLSGTADAGLVLHQYVQRWGRVINYGRKPILSFTYVAVQQNSREHQD